MKPALLLAASLLAAGCSRQEAGVAPGDDPSPADAATAQSDAAPRDASDGKKSASLKPLTPRQQERLLAARLDGGMDFSFRQFANMFLVTSRLHFGTGVGLMTSSAEIAETKLQSPFP